LNNRRQIGNLIVEKEIESDARLLIQNLTDKKMSQNRSVNRVHWLLVPKSSPNFQVKAEENRRDLEEAREQLKEAVVELKQVTNLRDEAESLGDVLDTVTERMISSFNLEPELFEIPMRGGSTTQTFERLKKRIYNLVLTMILLSDESKQMSIHIEAVKEMLASNISDLSEGRIPLSTPLSYVGHIQAIERVGEEEYEAEDPPMLPSEAPVVPPADTSNQVASTSTAVVRKSFR